MTAMKAAVFYAPMDLRIEEKEIPKAGPEEVVVKVEVSGLCPSDVRIFKNGSSSVKPPVTMGHEFAGRIHQVGENVEGISEGESVNIPADSYCGKCAMCRSGHENVCENGMAFGYNVNGAHADYVLIPKRFVQRGGIFPLAKNADYEEASMTEPLACSLNTIESAGTKPGKTAVVIGDGPMGLMHVALAREYGASNIILVGLIEWKLKLGEQLGASRLINASEDDPLKAVANLTYGKGAEIVIVTAVAPQTLVQGLQMASKRGFVNIFGGTPKGVTFQLEPNIIHYGELLLTGTSGYTYGHYAKASQLLSSHRIPLKKLITQRFELEKIHDAIKVWDDKEKSMKIMLTR
jgi:L-iditol 2-dehydrogenase